MAGLCHSCHSWTSSHKTLLTVRIKGEFNILSRLTLTDNLSPLLCISSSVCIYLHLFPSVLSSVSAESEMEQRGDCIGALICDRVEGGDREWWQEEEEEVVVGGFCGGWVGVTCVLCGDWRTVKDVRGLSSSCSAALCLSNTHKHAHLHTHTHGSMRRWWVHPPTPPPLI